MSQTTVRHNTFAGHEGCFLTGQECNDVGHFTGLSRTTQRNIALHPSGFKLFEFFFASVTAQFYVGMDVARTERLLLR
jgi:hypothetical protein